MSEQHLPSSCCSIDDVENEVGSLPGDSLEMNRFEMHGLRSFHILSEFESLHLMTILTARLSCFGRDRSGGVRPDTLLDGNKVDRSASLRALSEERDDDEVSIVLCESDTFWLLHIPGHCVASDSPEAISVEEANGRYRALLKGRLGSELYADVGIQTVNNIVKAKDIQSLSEVCTPQYSQATGWEIHDALHSSQAEPMHEVQVRLPLFSFKL